MARNRKPRAREIVMRVDLNGEIVSQQERDIIESRWDDDRGYLIYANEMRLHIPYMGFPKDLRANDLLQVFDLAMYLTKDNALFHRDRPMTTNDMSEILEIQKPHVYSLLKRLTYLAILTRYETVFYINPFYVTINRHITPTCYRAVKTIAGYRLKPFARERLEAALQNKEE